MNLTTLELIGSGVPNVSFAKNLAKVKRLDLRKNKIRDLTPLSGLANLEFLDISDNQVTDLSPLLKLKNPQSLTLQWSGNPISKEEITRYYEAREGPR